MLTHICLLTFAVCCASAGAAHVMRWAAPELAPHDERGFSDRQRAELHVIQQHMRSEE